MNPLCECKAADGFPIVGVRPGKFERRRKRAAAGAIHHKLGAGTPAICAGKYFSDVDIPREICATRRRRTAGDGEAGCLAAGTDGRRREGEETAVECGGTCARRMEVIRNDWPDDGELGVWGGGADAEVARAQVS